MRFDVISIFPDMIWSGVREGVCGRALSAGKYQLKVWNPRDFTTDRYQTVDDRPYGGGPGMVMKYQPLADAIAAARTPQARVVYLSPQGQTLTQRIVEDRVNRQTPLILVAGRYEGIDQRFIDQVCDEEWSLGDYILSGGELAALVVIDAMVRLLPGVLGHHQSAAQDSHSTGLLDCPHYTRPEQVAGQVVPDVLLSGDHQAISDWRRKQALLQTYKKRPDLLLTVDLSARDKAWLMEFTQNDTKVKL
ncbi:MAG: tRNA (guanosine(37)-N1)-methyltransferase TrmD [Methylococcales bacterium]|nr:tRNA (guanosine(37)-N1)-methyltransferase TrmD [Methylococcales bacterium]